MIKEFVTLPLRITRTDPSKADRQVTDFEDMLVNLDHVQLVHAGLTEDTCVLTFPGNVKQTAKIRMKDMLNLVSFNSSVVAMLADKPKVKMEMEK